MASLLSYIYDNKDGMGGTLLRGYIESGDPVPMYELQRAYRKCRYPYGAMVWLLLQEAGLEPSVVVDLTYGLGKFWSCWRPSYLVGYDVRRLDWVVDPDEFHQAPAWSALHHVVDGRVPRPELVVVDPPWQRGPRSVGRRNGHFRVSNGLGSPTVILESAARLSGMVGVPLLVHFGDRWVPQGFTSLAEVYWRPSLSRASPDYRTWWGILVRR